MVELGIRSCLANKWAHLTLTLNTNYLIIMSSLNPLLFLFFLILIKNLLIMGLKSTIMFTTTVFLNIFGINSLFYN